MRGRCTRRLVRGQEKSGTLDRIPRLRLVVGAIARTMRFNGEPVDRLLPMVSQLPVPADRRRSPTELRATPFRHLLQAMET